MQPRSPKRSSPVRGACSLRQAGWKPLSGEAGGRELDLLLYRAAIEVVAVDQDQAEVARLAWRRFGKGRHPAGLNYGDCFAYALAKTRRLPLLFDGDDFSQT